VFLRRSTQHSGFAPRNRRNALALLFGRQFSIGLGAGEDFPGGSGENSGSAARFRDCCEDSGAFPADVPSPRAGGPPGDWPITHWPTPAASWTKIVVGWACERPNDRPIWDTMANRPMKSDAAVSGKRVSLAKSDARDVEGKS
jgi:hypothetical protein